MSKGKILTALFFFLGILCVIAARVTYVNIKASQTSFKPQAVHMQLQPPKGAVQAQITTLSGDVKKEGRNDIDFKAIHTPTTFLQGEAVTTAVGSSNISFPHIITLTLGNNTELDYLNGLPNALVVRQPQGIITYTTSNLITPFSIRSLGLLIQITDKSIVTVTTDTSSQTVLVRVTTGTVTLAYSDSNNNTKVQQITQRHQALFDYTQSTLTVK